jgi:hypothetical protein
MKITHIHKYLTPQGIIEFLPENNVPGCSHRIYVDNHPRYGWLRDDRKPTTEMAVFYARMIAAEKEGKDKYYYIDKRLDP